MKKMKKSLLLILALAMTCCFLVACGGGGGDDALKGTWKTPDDSIDHITWTFDGAGKCTFDNTALQQEGTYTIEGTTATVKLELWDAEKKFDFTINGNEMSFIDQAGLASVPKLIKQD